jgi:tyrosine-protein phosphatase non-receptor type 14/21
VLIIQMTIGSENFQYIAAQGPLAVTAVDFWQMVWESKANLIIMVTSEVENDRVKCFHYWPPDEEPHGSIAHGKFTVSGQYCNDTGSTVTRGFHLSHPSEVEPRVVWQLQFIGWPDHGVPENPETFLNFIDEMGSLRRHAISTSPPSKSSPPTIVHCSAGVGRTGVTILMELLVTAIQQNERISIRRFLSHIRSQRMALVQTPGQYKFVYQAILSFLQRSKSNRLI